MSAYICGKNHFAYLVTAATSSQINGPGEHTFRWFHNEEWHSLEHRDVNGQINAANMLLLENITSVAHRYPGDKTSATLPGPIESGSFTARDFSPWPEYNPVQVLESISCLNYQSCEHPTWEKSEACAFLESLKGACIRSLCRRQKTIWGAPEREVSRPPADLTQTMIDIAAGNPFPKGRW